VHVELHLFAVARQAAGTNRLRLELAEPATVASLRRAVGERVPALRPLLPSMWVAVDAAYASDDAVIGPESELALIPPVSGGADQRPQPPRPAPNGGFRVANLTIDPVALEMIPESIAREFQVLPLEFDGKRLTLVFARGSEIPGRIAQLRLALNFANPIRWSRGDARALALAIDEAYSLPDSEVANCPPEYRDRCPRLWLRLVPTPQSDVRVCQVCRCLVHLCQTESEEQAMEAEGRRVALFQPVVDSEAVDALYQEDMLDEQP
jgi:molybdopterin converting factor small subunit